MKIMKTKYLNAAELLRFSSGFGWDSTTKRFTASKEVWAEYLKVKKHKAVLLLLLFSLGKIRGIAIQEILLRDPSLL